MEHDHGDSTSRDRGQTEFVKEVLAKNPRANPKTVNEEWKASGQVGTISATLVNKLRASMGLAGNLRPTNQQKARRRPSEARSLSEKTRVDKPKKNSRKTALIAASCSNGIRAIEPALKTEQRPKVSSYLRSIEELEEDIDRLLFKVMRLGGLPAIEESLRQTRRLLYGGFSGMLLRRRIVTFN
jgi:hypothetical protein